MSVCFSLGQKIRIKDIGNTVTLLFISGCIFFNYVFQGDTLAILSIILSILMMLCCSYRLVIPNAIYLSFFSYLFNVGRFNLYFFVICFGILRLILKRANNLKYFIYFVVYCLAHFHSTELSNISFGTLIPGISFTLLIMVFGNIYEMDLELMRRYYISGFFTSSFLGLFKAYTSLGEILDVDYLPLNTGVRIERFSALTYDSNFYGFLALIAICVFLLKPTNNGNSKLTLFIAVLLGCLTFSKSYYLCLVVVLFVVLLFSNIKTKKYIILFSAIVLLIWGTFKDKLSSYFELMVARFTNAKDFNSFTSGRFVLWKKYWIAYTANIKSIVFGYGVGANLGKAAHNTYIQILFEYGMIGFVFDICTLIVGVWSIAKFNNNRNLLDFLPLGICLVVVFNLSVYAFYSLWVCILMAMLFIAKGDKKV